MNNIVYKHSSGGVVINKGKVLVISSASRNSIGLPKGTIDDGETPEQAAVREVKEETGYDVEIIQKLNDYTYEFDWEDGTHCVKTVTYYFMKLSNNLEPMPNLQPGEDFESKWVMPSDAFGMFTFSEAKDALKLALNSSKLA